MNTAKNDIFIVLKHEYCYLVGEISLWWWQRIKNLVVRGVGGGAGGGEEVSGEEFFQVREGANFWLVGGIPQQGNPVNCCDTT